MKLNTILSSLLLTTLGLVGCESVDETERWTPLKPVEMKKNVLVEDFTGQKCKNCPTAAELLSTLSASSMGEHIIAVSIHGGSLAIAAEKQSTGLAMPQGIEYNTHWGVQSWPSGLVDRGSYDGGAFKVGKPGEATGWTTAIVDRMSQELMCDIDLHTTYDEASRKLSVAVNVAPTEGHKASDGHKVTVWLTESGVVGPQTMPDGTERPLYVHNHVLRDVLSADLYGDNLKVADAGYAPYTLDYTIPETFRLTGKAMPNKPENMAVIAFVTDVTGQVLQVVEREVVEK